jgi:hypothetical protein
MIVKITPAEAQDALNALVACGGNKAAAARSIKKKVTTYKRHLEAAHDMGLKPGVIPPVPENAALGEIIEGLRAELDRTREALAKATKPHFTVRQDANARGSKIRVVCIGDAHDSPNIPDKSRFEFMGMYVNEVKPDIVIQIGDFATLDSLNGHIPNETYQGKSKPSFMADMVSFNEALDAMQIEGAERHCTLGNHERRLYHFEDRAPEAYGMMQCELQKVFERHKWTFSPYGMPYIVGGVSFVHCALNSLGKSYGGKNAENTIANDAIGDWVIGHSHRERMHRAAKLGSNNFVKIVNVGCALPDGFIEDYARHTLTGWSYGIADMTIKDSHIRDYRFVSMAELYDRYGVNT